jgi:biotin carboxyl carrier protein
MEVRDPRRWSRQSRGGAHAGTHQIKAPMPGKVVRVLAAAGDVVEAGQGVVVVEAMKMQNELKAPRAGRVIGVTAKIGATVTAGEVLATVEFS